MKPPFWSNLCRTNGWPSTSKFLSVAGGLTALLVLLIVSIRGVVPPLLPELVGWILLALVLNKGASKIMNGIEAIKGKKDEPASDS